MKKNLIALVCLLFINTIVIAQDIIITKDAKQIKAKISEISKSEVRYKEFDNLDGPTFIIETVEINSILYSNGKVLLYNESLPTPTAAEPTVQLDQASRTSSSASSSAETTKTNDYDVTILTLDGQTIHAKLINMNNAGVTYELNGQNKTLFAEQLNKVALSNGQIKTYSKSNSESKQNTQNSIQYVRRSGNTYYYNNQAFRGSKYSDFLATNCTPAYDIYTKGSVTAFVGWILFAAGVGMDIGNLIGTLPVGGNADKTTAALAIVASALEIASIPTLIVGYKKMHKSAEIFNAQCSNKSQPQSYLSINASQNGVGIALNF